MPSCDGSGSNCSSNCSACSVRTETIHLDDKERKQFEAKIRELKAELANEQKINR